MAAALVSPLMEAMIKKVGSYIWSQNPWWSNIKDDLTKLKETLEDTQMVVAAAERRQIMDQYQSKLLRDLKDVMFEADDVLDEFEYQDMELRAKKARDPVSCIASSSLRFAKRLIGQDEPRNQLREVLEKLKNINTRAERLIAVLQLDRTIPREQVDVDPSRVTSSIISEARIFGRDKEKEEIVSLLVQQLADEPESRDSKPFHAILIVGIGGVGKTTLVQFVYNDTRVASKEHFELHMWVCASDRFDEVRLTKDMLVSASPNSKKQQDLPFDVLQKKLQTKLKSKKFLLVLDDVWMDEKRGDFGNKQMWEKLLAPLKYGAKGSKILVTTRMEKVADMFNEKILIFLEGLEKDKYWQLFTRYAFGNKNPDDYPELKQIALEIAKRLKGSPLAAKVVGSMLQSKFNIEKWNEILEKKAFDDINNILKLSYEHLPDHLKNCFAYCSIFPKDWKFNRQTLAFLWVAQGYVQSHEGDNRTEENIGIDYFDELVSRSFFQIVEKHSLESYYVMHDLIHDLAEHVSINECFRIDGGEQRSIGQSIRHIGVFIDEGSHSHEDVWSQLEKMSNRKDLRTLLFIGWMTTTLPSWFKEVRSLRVLGFDCGFEGDIRHLVHLRYLDLGCGYIWAESLSGLYHLKVVFADHGELRYSESLTELSTFGKLIHIFGATLEFVLGEERGVRDLKDIKLLHGGGLSIENMENVRSEVEAAEVGLEHREKLCLKWGDSERRIVRHDSEEKVIDALKPHPNLKDLDIGNFGGRRCPSWLETNWLIHLECISLWDCKGLEVMPPLGHLPFLKHLILGGMDSMERIGREFYGHGDHGVQGFPLLKGLWFDGMPAWVEWSAPEFPVFPRLWKLFMGTCPKLKRFPSFPRAVEEPVTARGMSPLVALQNLQIHDCTEELLASMIPDDDDEEDEEGRGILPPSLISLTIRRCGVSNRCLSRYLQGLSSLSWLEIQDCNGLTSLPYAEVLHRLTALQNMYIQNCKELESFGGLHALPSLQNLELCNCPKLESLPEEDKEGRGILPPSLASLVIREYGVTDMCLSRCLQGLASLSKLDIRFCNSFTSLPSAEVLHRLTALQQMSIQNCKELASLGGLHALPSLQELYVTDCHKLESLPEEGLPPSIKDVRLEGCHPALEKQMHEKEGPEWDKISCIPSLRLLGSSS